MEGSVKNHKLKFFTQLFAPQVPQID